MSRPPDRVGLALGPIAVPRREERIGPLSDVNAQCLRWLIKVSSHGRHAESGLLGEISGRLCALTTSERSHAARFPFLLVDMRFDDLEWWHRMGSQVGLAPPRPLWLSPLPRKSTVGLARSTLVLAWHTARVDREAAVLLIGLSPPIASHLTRLHLQDLDRVAEKHYRHLRPRWSDQPSIWRHLLEASRTQEMTSGASFVLRGLQLAAGELLPIQAQGLAVRERSETPSVLLARRRR